MNPQGNEWNVLSQALTKEISSVRELCFANMTLASWSAEQPKWQHRTTSTPGVLVVRLQSNFIDCEAHREPLRLIVATGLSNALDNFATLRNLLLPRCDGTWT